MTSGVRTLLVYEGPTTQGRPFVVCQGERRFYTTGRRDTPFRSGPVLGV